MRLLIRVSFAVFIALVSPFSHADGNSLLEDCIEAEHFLNEREVRNQLKVGYCTGVIQGVMNTMYIFEEPLSSTIRLCWPESGTNSKQGVRIVTKFLRDNPDKLHENQFGLVVQAFMDSFACK